MFHPERAGGQCLTNISCYSNYHCHLYFYLFTLVIFCYYIIRINYNRVLMHLSIIVSSYNLFLFFFFKKKYSVFVIQDNPLTIVHDWAHCQPCIMGVTTWRCVGSGVSNHITSRRSGCVKLKYSMCTQLSISITYCSIIMKGSTIHVLILSILHSFLWYFNPAYRNRYEPSDIDLNC